MKKRKCYIILGISKDLESNKPRVIGYDINYKTSLTNVLVFRTAPKEEGFGLHTTESMMKMATSIIKDQKKIHSLYEWKVFRVGSKNCPVTLDWNKVGDIYKKKTKFNNTDFHNLKYYLK